ncbi:hypothetical protein M405DRAFT_804913 [Rhizopogon salebrosus TDB-379]|nr:hypothetical protein M405DRAFT_804913 [Rhizopogon salebrosus TDB-379]
MLDKCVGSGHVATGLRIIIIFAMFFGRTSSSRTQAQCWMFIIDTPMLYTYNISVSLTTRLKSNPLNS